MGADSQDWQLHRRIAGEVPKAPARVGYAELQRAVAVGQRGRIKRAVSTLVGLDVLRWAGQRNGRAVSQGPADLDEVLAKGLTPMPEREIQTYPLLTGPLDDFITHWHTNVRRDLVDTTGSDQSTGDGVTTYNTSSLRAGSDQASASYTRPDLTVVVDLEFAQLGPWNEVHAVEVKPYWAVNRAALFEAAAQAALRRCTFSWLLVWVPDPDSGHFTGPQKAVIRSAQASLYPLKSEAEELGLGLLLARDLDEFSALEPLAMPIRQAMEPRAADELFAALGRVG